MLLLVRTGGNSGRERRQIWAAEGNGVKENEAGGMVELIAGDCCPMSVQDLWEELTAAWFGSGDGQKLAWAVVEPELEFFPEVMPSCGERALVVILLAKLEMANTAANEIACFGAEVDCPVGMHVGAVPTRFSEKVVGEGLVSLPVCEQGRAVFRRHGRNPLIEWKDCGFDAVGDDDSTELHSSIAPEDSLQ